MLRSTFTRRKKHSCLFSQVQDVKREKFHPSPTIKTMLLQDSRYWVTWCLSPWKQAHWRGGGVSSWREIRNRWRLSLGHTVSALGAARGGRKPDADSNYIQSVQIWQFSCQKQKCSVCVRDEKAVAFASVFTMGQYNPDKYNSLTLSSS